ncbi:anion permease [Shigella flexneri]
MSDSDDVHLHGRQNHQLYVFTAMAGNILALKNDQRRLHLQISWGEMGAGHRIPGHRSAAGHPLVIYTSVSARIRRWITKTIGKAGLAELGPMKIHKKCCSVSLCWRYWARIFSKSLGVDRSTVAIVYGDHAAAGYRYPGKTWC